MNRGTKKDIAQAIATILVMASAVFVAIDQTLPPHALSASTGVTEFSAERAIEHIKAIAQENLDWLANRLS